MGRNDCSVFHDIMPIIFYVCINKEKQLIIYKPNVAETTKNVLQLYM